MSDSFHKEGSCTYHPCEALDEKLTLAAEMTSHVDEYPAAVDKLYPSLAMFVGEHAE